MSNFRFEKLASLVNRVKVGFVGPVNDFYCSSKDGVPIIRTTDIDDIDLKKLKYVSKEFHLKNKKSQLKKGNLIIARHGENGNAVVYNLNNEAQVLNAVIIEPNLQKVNSELLKIFFDSPYVKKQILGSVKGSVQGVINTQHISEIKLNISDEIDYDDVVNVITSLDSKIEFNIKINRELEAMAKTLYDYWFVQFDFPFDFAQGRPDANGKPYKSSGGKMVFNEELKREIPESWSSSTISGWIANDKSGDWGKEQLEGNYTERVSCIRGADINGLNGKGEVKSPERYILEKNSHKILEVGDFIIEISGGSPTQSTGRMAFITEETLERFENPLICSNFCKAVTLKEKHMLFNFVYEWNRIYDAGVLFGWEGKTSGIKNFLFESFVTNYKIVQPPKELMEIFYEKAKPIHAQIQKNLQQNQKLADLRDWLLPMLMNGQVTVGEGYDEGVMALGMVAEEGAVYDADKEAIDALFASINYDYEVAAILLLTQKRFGFTYGKKYIHKMFSNIEMVNTLPVFKDLVFEENGWGMFSRAIEKTIDNEVLIQNQSTSNGTSVLKVKSRFLPEVGNWIKQKENKEFVDQVNDMLSLYEKSIIDKSMDRIELFNTVLECMKVLETDDFEAIRLKMEKWPMKEDGFTNKAEKFKSEETRHMIRFIKDEILK